MGRARYPTIRRAALAIIDTLVVLTSVVPRAPGIAYTVKTVERDDPNTCRPPVHTCVYVRYTFPMILQAPKPAAAAALNRAVRDFLLTSPAPDLKYLGIEAAMDAFMQDYQHSRQLDPDVSVYFYEERTVAILYQSPTIVSVQFHWEAYTGGAHENEATTFASFDTTNGKRITLDDVLVAGYRLYLTRTAEDKFRVQHNIKPGVTLSDAGYSFDNDAFALNDNFWFDSKGVTFFYNRYEIGSWALGTPVVSMSYDEIRGLIRPNGLLGGR